MYTMTRKDAYSSSEVPRSFSKIITPIEMTHAASSGARSRGRGRFIPKTWVPAVANRLRFSTSTAAKKINSRILDSSAG